MTVENSNLSHLTIKNVANVTDLNSRKSLRPGFVAKVEPRNRPLFLDAKK